MNVLIITGEISSDHYGAELAKVIVEKDPQSRIIAIGGAELKSIAHEFIYESASTNAVGITEVFGQSNSKKHLIHSLKRFLTHHSVDKALIIDCAHQNESIAAVLKEFDVPITTIITPNFWIWKDEKKANRLIQYSQNIIAIFKQEADYYESLGAEGVQFFGHPLRAEIVTPQKRERQKKSPQAILLNPGSRQSEIKCILPKMIQIAEALSQLGKYRFYVLNIDQKWQPLVEEMTFNAKIKIQEWQQPSEDIVKEVDFVISMTGTSTLHYALNKIPQVILGALSPVSFWIGKWIMRLKIPFVGLPNIVMKKEIVPEYIQKSIQPDPIAHNIHDILSNDEKYTEIQKNYEELEAKMPLNPKIYEDITAHLLSPSI